MTKGRSTNNNNNLCNRNKLSNNNNHNHRRHNIHHDNIIIIQRKQKWGTKLFKLAIIVVGITVLIVYTLPKKILPQLRTNIALIDDNIIYGDYDGPPSDLVVHGRRDYYKAAPDTHAQSFYMPMNQFNLLIPRAFRHHGWISVENVTECQFYFLNSLGDSEVLYTLKPWQRPSQVLGSESWKSFEDFIVGFMRYKRERPTLDLSFVPNTFLLKEEIERRAFAKQLQLGPDRAWVLKKIVRNTAFDIEVLGPNSFELNEMINRAERDKKKMNYAVQPYICNQLTWYHGQRFQIRSYWMVASMDPYIVLYHDGFANVQGQGMDIFQFTMARYKATHKGQLPPKIIDGSRNNLWNLIREHYNNDKNTKNIIVDPIKHVRDQMKHALGTFATAFKFYFPDYTSEVFPENMFAFYGADFIVDQDLDVYLMNVDANPAMPQQFDFQIDMFREMLRPMVRILEEITNKQVADSNTNLLPIQSLESWDIIYAGDWQYEYKTYQRAEKNICQESSKKFFS